MTGNEGEGQASAPGLNISASSQLKETFWMAWWGTQMAVPAGMCRRPPSVMSCVLLTRTWPTATGGYIRSASCGSRNEKIKSAVKPHNQLLALLFTWVKLAWECMPNGSHAQYEGTALPTASFCVCVALLQSVY